MLEVLHRAPLGLDAEWQNFLEALAARAAIAIDNATLFDDLQRSNIDLMLAYDATLEGWARALDLRSKETERHTERVTEMTMRLARTMGIGDKELVHIRRGALLHDIGKIGIPDSILLQPGPLTDEEWLLMRKHPQLAFEMLQPIAYLRPALDIPYAHHEHWDGTGYPRGLKGEQIPWRRASSPWPTCGTPSLPKTGPIGSRFQKTRCAKRSAPLPAPSLTRRRWRFFKAGGVGFAASVRRAGRSKAVPRGAVNAPAEEGKHARCNGI